VSFNAGAFGIRRDGGLLGYRCEIRRCSDGQAL
jgi:hypothetical protein